MTTEFVDFKTMIADTLAQVNPAGMCTGCSALAVCSRAPCGGILCQACWDTKEAANAQGASAKAIRQLFNEWPARYRMSAMDTAFGATWLSNPATIPIAKLECMAPAVTFVGAAGRGKTTLAAMMARFRIDSLLAEGMDPRRPVLITALALSDAHLRKAWDEVSKAKMAPFVIIDDIGNDRNMDSSALTGVIDDRHAGGKATWFTTALSIVEVGKRYGGGMCRRIFENSLILDLGRDS